ncbi:MAG: CHASE3 domain-containing protein [Geminicoccaceae bacterium]
MQAHLLLSVRSPVRRVVLLMAAGALALLAIVGASLWLVASMERDAADMTRYREIRNAALTLMSLLQNSETGQRGYLLTSDRAYLEPYLEAGSKFPVTLAILASSNHEAIVTDETLARLSVLIETKRAELAQTIDLVGQGRQAAALDIVRSDAGKKVMDELRAILDQILERSEAQISARLGDMRADTRALGWVSVSASLLILLLAGGALFTLARYARELVRARRQVELANTGLEQRVTERTAELTRANEEIQRFAYIVSHDLRAPLVNVLGFTSELEAGLDVLKRFLGADDGPEPSLRDEARRTVDEDLPEALGFIRASTSKMDRLINAILKLSREGRRELNPQRIDLGALFTGIKASVQHQLDQAGATLEIGRLPVLRSDRLALEQIFGNLIDNAIKYLAPDRPGIVRVSAVPRQGRWQIEVADNGRGIAAADHDRIFELFRRSGMQDRPGEGIGLAHVRALARRLGGDVTVASDPGKGSRFTVVLPTDPAWTSTGGNRA